MKSIIFLVVWVIAFYGFQANGDLIRTCSGHKQSVYDIAMSKDGKYVASASNDRTCKLWTFPEGERVAEMIGDIDPQYLNPLGYMNAVSFHPDGEILAAGYEKNRVLLFNVPSGTLHATLWHTSPVTEVEFSPDGTILASCGTGIFNGDHIDYSQSCIKLWNFPSGDLMTTIPGLTGTLAWSPDGKTLASGGSKEKLVKIYNIPSGDLHVTFYEIEFVFSLAYSPDGKILAVGSEAYTVTLWDVPSGTLTRTLQKITGFWVSWGYVKGLEFSPDGTKLVSGDKDSYIKLWDVATGGLIYTFEGHNKEVSAVAFSPDGTKLASGSYDYKVKYWNVPVSGPGGEFLASASTKAASFSYFIGTIFLANVLLVAL